MLGGSFQSIQFINRSLLLLKMIALATALNGQGWAIPEKFWKSCLPVLNAFLSWQVAEAADVKTNFVFCNVAPCRCWITDHSNEHRQTVCPYSKWVFMINIYMILKLVLFFNIYVHLNETMYMHVHKCVTERKYSAFIERWAKQNSY